MSRRRAITVVVGVLAVLVVVIALRVLTNNDTTVIDVDEARAAATSSSSGVTTAVSATPTIPPSSGEVYVYDMSGHDEIDAFAGAEHEYPAATYLTISHGGCGQVWRWQAIEEHWSSWEVCDPQLVTVAGFDSFNEWFGVEDLQQYRCDGSASYLPPAPDVDTWTFECSTESIRQETTAEVVGMETVDVGGELIDAVHIHYVDTLSGDSSGGSETDRWFRLDDPLVVKEISSTTSVSTSVIGKVTYTEEYEIALQSLEPADR
jgi:hypothetical protein